MNRMLIFLVLSLSINQCLASEDNVIFEGFASKVGSKVDEMTDERMDYILLKTGSLYFYVAGPDSFTIFPNPDWSGPKLLFSPTVESQIRAPENEALSLVTSATNNQLLAASSEQARAIIQALVNGETIKLRYIEWPENKPVDIKISQPLFGFVYSLAAKEFGWDDLGSKAELPPVEVDIQDASWDRDTTNIVMTKGNTDLMLWKKSRTSEITIGDKVLLEITDKGKIGCRVYTSMGTNVVIRDSDANVVLEQPFDKKINSKKGALCNATVKKMMEVGALGSVQIVEGAFKQSASLYGFPEIWEWGIKNANFPAIGSID